MTGTGLWWISAAIQNGGELGLFGTGLSRPLKKTVGFIALFFGSLCYCFVFFRNSHEAPEEVGTAICLFFRIYGRSEKPTGVSFLQKNIVQRDECDHGRETEGRSAMT